MYLRYDLEAKEFILEKSNFQCPANENESMDRKRIATKIIAYEWKNSGLQNFIDDFSKYYERLSGKGAASQIKFEDWNE